MYGEIIKTQSLLNIHFHFDIKGNNLQSKKIYSSISTNEESL